MVKRTARPVFDGSSRSAASWLQSRYDRASVGRPADRQPEDCREAGWVAWAELAGSPRRGCLCFRPSVLLEPPFGTGAFVTSPVRGLSRSSIVAKGRLRHPRHACPGGHHLRPLRGSNAGIDYPAVMGSRERLRRSGEVRRTVGNGRLPPQASRASKGLFAMAAGFAMCPRSESQVTHTIDIALTTDFAITSGGVR